MPSDSTLSIALVYPELLGTYGDRGNSAALLHRARARDLDVELVEVSVNDPLPRQADVYLLGGGEDAAMVLAWDRLHDDQVLREARDRGASVFGVCAGFQLLSHAFAGPDGVARPGLGLLDVTCRRLDGPRAVGEVLADDLEGTGFLTGFENHQGDAQLGPAARPLGTLVRGVGNGDSRTEGAVQDGVIGTYLHGPALVRNDTLADRLLERVTGPLAPFHDEPVRRLRAERRSAALARRRTWRSRLPV